MLVWRDQVLVSLIDSQLTDVLAISRSTCLHIRQPSHLVGTGARWHSAGNPSIAETEASRDNVGGDAVFVGSGT